MAEDPITKALLRFGGGNLEAGAELLSQHPMLQYGEESGESLGLTLNTIDRVQKLWISAWKEANR